MNSLNSILIEGNLLADPVKADNRATFTVQFHRFFSHENERREEVGNVLIEVWNKTAELCLKTLAIGRGVRVVGRIRDIGDGKILVVGETIEFKTKFDRKE